MIKTYYEKKTIFEETCCQKCGKTLHVNGNVSIKPKEQELYFFVTTGHHQWAEDSHESIKSEYYCQDCLKEIIDNYLKTAEKTSYINIECEGFIHEYDFNKEGLFVDEDEY